MNVVFAGGGIFALILAGMLLEMAALAAFYRRTGRGIAPPRFLGDIGAGMCLLLATLLVLRGAAWPFPAVAILAALGAHLFDLKQRWRR